MTKDKIGQKYAKSPRGHSRTKLSAERTHLYQGFVVSGGQLADKIGQNRTVRGQLSKSNKRSSAKGFAYFADTADTFFQLLYISFFLFFFIIITFKVIEICPLTTLSPWGSKARTPRTTFKMTYFRRKICPRPLKIP